MPSEVSVFHSNGLARLHKSIRGNDLFLLQPSLRAVLPSWQIRVLLGSESAGTVALVHNGDVEEEASPKQPAATALALH